MTFMYRRPACKFCGRAGAAGGAGGAMGETDTGPRARSHSHYSPWSLSHPCSSPAPWLHLFTNDLLTTFPSND